MLSLQRQGAARGCGTIHDLVLLVQKSTGVKHDGGLIGVHRHAYTGRRGVQPRGAFPLLPEVIVQQPGIVVTTAHDELTMCWGKLHVLCKRCGMGKIKGALHRQDIHRQVAFAVENDDEVIWDLVGGTTAMPQTIVLNRHGEVVYNQRGSVTPEMLETLYEQAAAQ